MNSRTLVKKTLEFDSPDRVPRHLWYLPYAEEKYPEGLAKIRADFPDDIVNPPADYRVPPKTEGDMFTPGFYTDEWGSVFENRQSGIIGEVKEPILKDWSDLNKVRIPVEMLDFNVATVNEFCAETDKFVIGSCCPRPFERIQFLRGTENVYMDLFDRPDGFMELLSRIHNFYLDELEKWAKTDVDALNFMDDWGAQQSLLISPVMWREIFKPLYKDYIEIAHDHGKYIFMHSDGFIVDIYPDLIELGLDALNSQLFCMGVDKLSEFAGKITFWGEIDRQHILPNATEDEVAEAVRSVYSNLYANGGAIAQCEFGPGAKPENVYTVFKTWDSVEKNNRTRISRIERMYAD